MSQLPRNFEYDLARVLLVDDDPASRLTLKALLAAGGYNVDAAASAAEAVGKLEEREYELVLSDLQLGSPEAGLKVLAHARTMNYKPATALLTTYQNADSEHSRPAKSGIKPGVKSKLKLAPKSSSKSTQRPNSLLIRPVDVPALFSKVADLIGQRATRRMERELRVAGA